MFKELPEALEQNILVEFPVGPEFHRIRGYARFVRFRIGVVANDTGWALASEAGVGKLYALIQSPAKALTGSRLGSTPAPQCVSCGLRGATENGRCAICGTPRDSG